MPAPDEPAPAPLRADLDVLPIEHEGRPMFLLRDPESAEESSLALSPAGMAVAALLDGRRRPPEIADGLSRESGAAVSAENIRRLVRELEGCGLLETEPVRKRRRRLREEFARSLVRPAQFAGPGYPREPVELARFLGEFFPQGPGKPPSDKPSGPPPVGLVAPHIDLHRGGAAYARAYQALSEAEPPDAVVAVGVAHASPNSPWTLTRKAYETPYGPVPVDAELADAVQSCLWYDARDDEWVHRKEHSLEFQALWLKHLWRDKTPPWVPLLCSSFERFSPDQPPSATPTVEAALARIGEALAAAGKRRRILILAAVDLAHVGPRFGDEVEVDEALEKRVEAEDRGSLEKALGLDADGFYLSVVAGGHWRKVCGLSALYTSLRWMRALGARPGELLAYGQAPDPLGGIVSFAGARFPAPAG